MGALSRWAETRFDKAMALNLANIEHALNEIPAGGRLLDLGCDDGSLTVEFAKAAQAHEIHGVELAGHAADAACERGVVVTESDLNRPLPFDDGVFDVVVSNQVLEHLVDTDTFVSEIRRILRPAGVAVVSTENLASWHNVAALVLGWQPFSLSNVTRRRAGLGNPLAIHRAAGADGRESWQHVKVFSYRGLRELFEANGLKVRAIRGAGYYPLGAGAGKVDPRHAAFLTAVVAPQ